MITKYEYLKKYVSAGNKMSENWFSPISNGEIEDSEKVLGKRFPLELRTFYEELGFGMLRSPYSPPAEYDFFNNNEILRPSVACFFYKEILNHNFNRKDEAVHFEHSWLALEALEDLEPGDLPFFEISDSSSFMVMKLNSENPNAVWFMGHEKIEDSFERFIWRLYYEDPSYYTKNW